jgi:hypothetical protein
VKLTIRPLDELRAGELAGCHREFGVLDLSAAYNVPDPDVASEAGRSLHFGEMQGDFCKMQGGGRRNLAKSHQISIAWMASPYSSEQGRSRETIFA